MQVRYIPQVYVHMHIFMCVYAYIRRCVCAYAYIHVDGYAYIYIYIYIYICACVCVCTYILRWVKRFATFWYVLSLRHVYHVNKVDQAIEVSHCGCYCRGS